MGAVARFFAQFDLFSAPAFLRIKEDQKMKSCPIGFASLLLSCFFVYVFIVSCIGVLNYQSIDSNMEDTFISQDDAKGYVYTFAVGLDNLTIQQIDSMFVPLAALVYEINGAWNWTKMAPCTPERWSGLGEGYTSKFYEYNLDRFYCLNVSSPWLLTQTMISWTSHFFVTSIYVCSFYPISPTCNQTKAHLYIQYKNPQIQIYLLDTGFFPNQKVSTRPFINTDAKAYVSAGVTANVEIQFSKYRIQTDKSLISFSSNQIQEGTWISSIKNYVRPFYIGIPYTDVGSITIFMNPGLRIFRRTIGKLDNLLSYVGGLFQLLIVFFAFFISSFNEYRYELKVSEGAFNFIEDGRKIKEGQFTLLRYVQYGIYDWIKTLFCVKLKWKFCNQIDQVRDEVIYQMEVNRFIRRIRNAEMAVGYALGDNKKAVIKVIEPPSVQKVKERRLKLQYSQEMQKKQMKIFTKEYNQLKEKNQNKLTRKDSDIQLDQSQSTQKQDKRKIMAQTMVLNPQLQKAETDLANSLFAVNQKFRNQFQHHISALVLCRLKMKKQKLV